MELLDLYNLTEKEKLDVINYKWIKAKARIFENDNEYSIGIDYNKIDNSTEEKEILAEELGHYYCGALYYIDSDIALKRKCEIRAKKWAYSVLVPFQKLKDKIAQGFDLYDLADYFNVDIKYMIDCIDFYTEKYGILV